ncbi:MAG: hypothetical protein KBC02_01315 [Candidatus Pacebacteria bacterium]|nr:hypothetical protein [Candidatus Paceibacterota bacterium]
MTTSTLATQKGQMTLYVLIFSSVALVVLSGFVLWADSNIRIVFRDVDKSQAFMASEAGIEYYRWHLAHAPSDYKDGTQSSGPYTHDLRDKDGNVIAAFSLDITAPPTGSTVVTLNSTGTVAANSTVSKIIEAKMAIPSFAKYAAVIGSEVRFGEGTDLYGPIHSNGGVRMDGVAHNMVTSAVATYDDPDHSGGKEFGVHTHISPVDPLPPTATPKRSDIFMTGRSFPVAPVDFLGIAQDLSSMKTIANTSQSYWKPSGAKGYEIILKTNDTYDLYKVTSLVSAPSGCTNSQNETGWGTWSVSAKTLIGNKPIPSSGVIFVEDNAWVSGQISTARVTIASGRFPDNATTRSSITINSNLKYSSYTGSDVIALIAQDNINIGMVSATTLRIDAALMAENGRVGRYYYNPPTNKNNCGPYHSRSSITSFGMLASNLRYGFAYTDGTGYITRTIIYDANLLYGPPPSFPLTADFYTPIFWNEKK